MKHLNVCLSQTTALLWCGSAGYDLTATGSSNYHRDEITQPVQDQLPSGADMKLKRLTHCHTHTHLCQGKPKRVGSSKGLAPIILTRWTRTVYTTTSAHEWNVPGEMCVTVCILSNKPYNAQWASLGFKRSSCDREKEGITQTLLVELQPIDKTQRREVRSHSQYSITRLVF